MFLCCSLLCEEILLGATLGTRANSEHRSLCEEILLGATLGTRANSEHRSQMTDNSLVSRPKVIPARYP